MGYYHNGIVVYHGNYSSVWEDLLASSRRIDIEGIPASRSNQLLCTYVHNISIFNIWKWWKSERVGISLMARRLPFLDWKGASVIKFRNSRKVQNARNIQGVPFEDSPATIPQTIRHFKKYFKWIVLSFERTSIWIRTPRNKVSHTWSIS